jgi:hypothetical protein
MKKQIFYKILLAGSLVFNIVFIGMWIVHAVPRHFAENGESECGYARDAHGKCALQKALSINDSQWTLLNPGIESFRQTTRNLCHEIAKNRAALMDELEKTPTDSTAVALYSERIISCQKEMQSLVNNHVLKEKKMLSPDQMRHFFATLRSGMSCSGFPGMEKMKHDEDCKR